MQSRTFRPTSAANKVCTRHKHRKHGKHRDSKVQRVSLPMDKLPPEAPPPCQDLSRSVKTPTEGICLFPSLYLPALLHCPCTWALRHHTHLKSVMTFSVGMTLYVSLVATVSPLTEAFETDHCVAARNSANSGQAFLQLHGSLSCLSILPCMQQLLEDLEQTGLRLLLNFEDVLSELSCAPSLRVSSWLHRCQPPQLSPALGKQ